MSYFAPFITPAHKDPWISDWRLTQERRRAEEKAAERLKRIALSKAEASTANVSIHPRTSSKAALTQTAARRFLPPSTKFCRCGSKLSKANKAGLCITCYRVSGANRGPKPERHKPKRLCACGNTVSYGSICCLACYTALRQRPEQLVKKVERSSCSQCPSIIFADHGDGLCWHCRKKAMKTRPAKRPRTPCKGGCGVMVHPKGSTGYCKPCFNAAGQPGKRSILTDRICALGCGRHLREMNKSGACRYCSAGINRKRLLALVAQRQVSGYGCGA